MTGKIGLNHTEFCTRQVRRPQTVQTFSYEVKTPTWKILGIRWTLTYWMHVLSQNTVQVSSTFWTECLKTGLEFCARVKSVAHKLQTYSQEAKPQTEKFLVSDEHSHIKYMYYLKHSACSQYV